MAYTCDSKSHGLTALWVQVPPRALQNIKHPLEGCFIFCGCLRGEAKSHMDFLIYAHIPLLRPNRSGMMHASTTFGGMKELHKQKNKSSEPLPESYLLCRECDGTWVDSHHGNCAHCAGATTSRDFHLCLACSLRECLCQHCGDQVQVHISQC